jgi:hypothetical protein
MPKAMLEKIGEALDRRGFLSKLVNVTGSLLVGIVAVPKSARAVIHPVGCCNLCVLPSTCSYDPLSCASQWRWVCCAWNRVYYCWECFMPGFACMGTGCDGVVCSRITCEARTPPTECPEIPDDLCPTD